MKVLLVILGLIVFGACATDTNDVEQEQVKTEQQEEVKTEQVAEVKEEVKTDTEQLMNDKYKAEYETLFKNSPYSMINFEYDNEKHLVTLQAEITRDEWVNGFYSQLDTRDSYCGQIASSVGRPNKNRIADFVSKCKQEVATGKFDNLKWVYIYHNMNGYTEQAEFDEVFKPLASLYCLTGDKNKLEITVVDINGDLIYKVANENKDIVFNSLKTWVSDEQLWILSHVNEFQEPYALWFGYYEGWLGLN